MLRIRNVDSTNPVSEKHISGTSLRISYCLHNCFYSTCSEGSPKVRLNWHDSPTSRCSMRFTYCEGRSRARFAVAAGNWKTWRIPVFCDTKRRHRVIPFPTFRGNTVFTLHRRKVPEQWEFFWKLRPLTMKTLRYRHKRVPIVRRRSFVCQKKRILGYTAVRTSELDERYCVLCHAQISLVYKITEWTLARLTHRLPAKEPHSQSEQSVSDV